MAVLARLLLLLCSPSWGLSAAAGKVDITPDLPRHTVYLAGFGARGRKPEGVHDRLFARLLVLKDGPRTVALVSLDLLGFSRNDVEDLRSLAGFAGPDRYLFAAATHVHSGPDTLGLWGPLPGVSGVDAAWLAELKMDVAAALRKLEGQAQEARLTGWRGTLDPKGLCRDLRDPAVLDPGLAALSVKAPGGKAIATVVNWSCHPETLGRSNLLITADFPGSLCAKVEDDTGGACLFLNGAIGGLLSPDLAAGQDPWRESARIGATVAGAALQGLALSRPFPEPKLEFRNLLVRVPVENSRYLLFLPALRPGHRLYDKAGAPLPRWKVYGLVYQHALRLLQPPEKPWVETEVSVVDAGPARLVGLPGEAFPELVLGGYDGSLRFGQPLLKPENPDPPDLAHAPTGPYLKELVRRPVPMVVGMANDELGYLVPEYDFKVRENLTMTPRLPGDHYEETNSVGPAATRIILDAAQYLLSRKK
ncbi:MAG: hypothetical protein HY926_14105 [Elusimicrobia bacterium]|nr:hypothetical protein [Elusimicrobiota bacterium]